MTWRLYCSGGGPLVEVMPDERYSGMWRIRTRDGRLSDMVNLARAKDAARLVARDENPALHDVAKLHWKKDSGKSRQEGPTARTRSCCRRRWRMSSPTTPPSGGKLRQWEAIGIGRASWYRHGKP